MAKKVGYVCSACGHEESNWVGRCPACGEWGTLEETLKERAPAKAGARTAARRSRRLKDISSASSERWSTGYDELNRVLGGGLVRDSVTMLTAKPGAGKSTLLLQAAGRFASSGVRCLYASGEESEAQIKSRALRILPEESEELFLISTNSMDDVIEECRRLKPKVLFLDSVQTMALSEYAQRPGTPTQTVQVTASLVDLCKDANAPMAAFLIGHMTKGEEMAGLRTLEHLVDTVLYLDTGADDSIRMLRSTKNRFGRTGEMGLFQMEEEGLIEVTDPYALFLTKRQIPVPGAAVSLQQEGSRFIPIEVEALVSPATGAYPIRIGDSLKRDVLTTLVSILEQRAGQRLSDKDVVLKVTGGLSIFEKTCDLAVLAAIVSARCNRAISGGDVFLAEVGLTGELKHVHQLERRLVELDRLGFQRAFVAPEEKLPTLQGLKIVPCRTAADVFSVLFGGENRKKSIVATDAAITAEAGCVEAH
ncbi:MAG: DNA repair protein RadA [Ndongobacter sp.]|nr:DNA repair protein RadA [Ndongobacter sp.]